MRKANFISVMVISFSSMLITVQAQVPTKRDIKLVELIGKSSVEIDQILGNPKRSGDVPLNRTLPPIITKSSPERFRSYKLDSMNLVIYFYHDAPVVFQIGYPSQRKRPESVPEALAQLGIEEKGRFLTEDKVDPLTYSSPLKQRVQSWEGYIGQVKCRKIEATIFDSESFQLLKGRQTKRQIINISIAVPFSK